MEIQLRWTQRRMSGGIVVGELSRDRGRSWRAFVTAPAEDGRVAWRVEGAWGPALVRLRALDGGTSSSVRRVVLVAPVRDISINNQFGAALHEDGLIRIWGAIDWGPVSRIGHDRYPGDFLASLNYSVPTILPNFDRVAAISAEGAHLAAIREDGTVWLWGQPHRWWLGPEPKKLTSPRRIEGIEDATWVRAGFGRTFVKVRDGRVFGIPGDDTGIFLDEEGVTPLSAQEVPELRDVTDIALGHSHALALRPDGTVVSWGNNFQGPLGDGSVGHPRPSPVPGLEDIVAIAAKFESSLALGRDGRVRFWGLAHRLQIDGGEVNHLEFPYLMPAPDRVSAIACASTACYAIRDDGTLWAWGAVDCLSEPIGVPFLPAPVQCDLFGVRRFFAGAVWSQVLLDDGRRLTKLSPFKGPNMTGTKERGYGWAPLYSR